MLVSALAKPTPSITSNQKNVVVVGGGIGGLAAAGRLARAGCNVTILEKNSDVGGRVQSLTLGDCFRFDTGPSLLLFRDKYEEALSAMGVANMEEVLPTKRVVPSAYRVFFGDNSSLDIINDMAAMEAQLEAVEPGAGAAYGRFVAMARKNLELGVPNFIDRDFTELADAKGLSDLLPQLPSLNPINLLGNHDWVMKRFFKDRRLRALFTFQDLYVGLKPSSAPAVFSLLAGTEILDGVHYPIGGFQSVRNAFQAAAEANGVVIQTSAEVKSIIVHGGTVTGIELESGKRVEADIVLCNRDLPAAYELLKSASESEQSEVQEYADQRSRHLANAAYSTGVIAYNWAVNKRLDGLLHHNIFLSDDYNKSWVPAATPAGLLSRPNFYVHCPARTDPSAAPENKDSVMVLLPVANMQGNEHTNKSAIDDTSSSSHLPDYEGLVTAGKSRILDAFKAVGLGDIEPLIEHELIIPPPKWRDMYGLKHGAAFGLAHGLNQLSIFRPPNKDPEIQGLYFVGASTRPGNGVPLALISGKLCAQRIAKDYKLNTASNALL